MIKFELDFGEVKRNLRKLNNTRLIEKAVKRALSKVALQMRRDSVNKVPRVTGSLVNSWKEESTGKLSIEVGYDIIYAFYQHQGRRNDGSHYITRRPGGGQSFFLKDPIEQNLQKYYNIYGEEILKSFNKL